MSEAILYANDVRHTYGSGVAQTTALNGVSLRFETGRVHLIRGPSGSGKTTLLSVLGGLLSPTEGEVRLFGGPLSRLTEPQRVKLRRRHIGFVFQAFRLFRALTALENVVVAVQVAGTDGRNASQVARGALAAVGLDGKGNRFPHQLSGGEKQRVALARALINDPDVVLADEPTASLDRENGLRVAGILRSIAVEAGRAVLIVSHDPRLKPYADRVIELQDGRIAYSDDVASQADCAGGKDDER